MASIRWFFVCAPLFAQSLQILPSPPSGKPSGSFRVMLVAPGNQPTAALQWRILAPRGVNFAPAGIQSGPAAEQARKTLNCTATTQNPQGGAAVMCLVAGGKERIPNGAVAIMHFTAEQNADAVTIRLDKILGAMPDGKAVSFPNTQATLPLKGN